MSDGTNPADQAEPETPAIETEGQETEALDEGQEPEAEEGEHEQADEFDEIEHEGSKHRIPKALKPLFLMQSDYTKKTQEVADQRRAIESERESLTKSVEAQKQHISDLGRLKVMEEALDQYQKVDWPTARAQNPEQANAAFQDFMTLSHQRDTLAGKVQKAIEDQSQEAQRDFAKRYEETTNVLVRDIKGWNAETAAKVRDFAIGNGVTADELRQVATNPRFAKILHKAWLGEQLITKQQAAAKAAGAKRPAAETEVKPLTVVGRKPSGNAKPGVHDGLSTEEWMRRENARVTKLRTG